MPAGRTAGINPAARYTHTQTALASRGRNPAGQVTTFSGARLDQSRLVCLGSGGPFSCRTVPVTRGKCIAKAIHVPRHASPATGRSVVPAPIRSANMPAISPPKGNTAQLAQLKTEPPAMMELSQVPKWQGDSDEFFMHRCGRAGAVAHGRTSACSEAYHSPRPSPSGSATHRPCPPPLPASAGLVHGVVRDRPGLVLSATAIARCSSGCNRFVAKAHRDARRSAKPVSGSAWRRCTAWPSR